MIRSPWSDRRSQGRWHVSCNHLPANSSSLSRCFHFMKIPNILTWGIALISLKAADQPSTERHMVWMGYVAYTHTHTQLFIIIIYLKFFFYCPQGLCVHVSLSFFSLAVHSYRNIQYLTSLLLALFQSDRWGHWLFFTHFTEPYVMSTLPSSNTDLLNNFTGKERSPRWRWSPRS